MNERQRKERIRLDREIQEARDRMTEARRAVARAQARYDELVVQSIELQREINRDYNALVRRDADGWNGERSRTAT